jgi:hypothetical protein
LSLLSSEILPIIFGLLKIYDSLKLFEGIWRFWSSCLHSTKNGGIALQVLKIPFLHLKFLSTKGVGQSSGSSEVPASSSQLPFLFKSGFSNGR